MVERHGGAMRWFSIVAIAFHGFFVPYLAAAFVLPIPDLLPEQGRSWFGPSSRLVEIRTGRLTMSGLFERRE